PSPTEIYTLSLHDALPIYCPLSQRLGPCLLVYVSRKRLHVFDGCRRQNPVTEVEDVAAASARAREHVVGGGEGAIEWAEQQRRRSEEHTSELQSRSDLVCR